MKLKFMSNTDVDETLQDDMLIMLKTTMIDIITSLL